MNKRIAIPGFLLALVFALVGSTSSAMAASAPAWSIDHFTVPTNLVPGGSGAYQVEIENVSTAPAATPPTVVVELPPGVTATYAGDGLDSTYAWGCPGAAGSSVVTCNLELANIYPPGEVTFAQPVPPIVVAVDVAPTVAERGVSTAHVFGGGAAAEAVSTWTTHFTTDPTPFDFTVFSAWGVDENGQAARQAGSHPDFTTDLSFGTTVDGKGRSTLAGNLKDVSVTLPPGYLGNPTALPACPAALMNVPAFGVACPPETQVGTAAVKVSYGGSAPLGVGKNLALYNLVAPVGTPGRFAFNLGGVIVNFNPVLRTNDNGEYVVAVNLDGISQTLALWGSKVTFWGVPADSSHDTVREGGASAAPPRPFFTNPTECSGRPQVTRAVVNSWQDPGTVRRASEESDFEGGPNLNVGCNQLDFNPSIEARPTTNLADSPSGLDVNVRVPLNDDADGLAAAHVRDVTVSLPAGLTVNPSSAQGLEACSPAQIGLTSPVGEARVKFDGAPVSCPAGSKLGTVQVDSPLIDHPLPGAIYLARQNENPFNSLLALYVAIEDPRSGIRIKLAGHPVLDPTTGRLTASFDRNPQLPFESLKVNLFTGPRAALKTPMACGGFTTTSTMVPWSSPEGADANPSDSFGIVAGANNGPCLKSDADAPNRPSLIAGAADPAAGTYSPFSLRIVREDGTQPIKAIDATLPKGLLGKLAGIPYCPDGALATAAGKSGRAEQASASCPATSQVGSVEVAAGAGSNPLNVPGRAYLAGPYRGAPLSLAIVTPAVAGPFDLGTVVVRTRLEVNPETAQIHAVSDEIPTILQGIPLDVRSITVNMDRPSFTLNPTSCDPSEVAAGVTSILGQTTALANRFQVGGCNALGFKPKLALKLIGPTRRATFPALKATLSARPGDANIGRAQVTLPKSQFLAQEHIRTICTRVQFAARACPAGSIYGKAKAWSPLLDQPLSGPVYLRSSSNPLPDLVASLDGQIHLDLVGRIDSVKARLRSTFDSVPDAPVSKFVLDMQGGKKGLLVNNTNLCKTKPKADVQLDAQSGKTYDFNPVVKADCGKKSKKKHKKKSGQSKPHKKG